MKFLKWFYESLGNSKSQRFWRLLLLVMIVGVIVMGVVNVGYDKTKGGLYWKPADISLRKQ